jgi:SPX domain protein involved in polyphosphate accumulation
MLYLAVEEAPAVESVEEDILKRHFANFDETFFNYCDSELKKINTFYSEKLAEATRKFATLNSELKVSLEALQKGKSKSHQTLKKKTLPYRKIQVENQVKLFFSIQFKVFDFNRNSNWLFPSFIFLSSSCKTIKTLTTQDSVRFSRNMINCCALI